ncbi:fimbrial protein, partial [Klebsiella michiganensis]
DGAQNIGIILKKNGSAIKFNDLSAYPFVSAKSQDLTLTADYFKIAKNISAGITGEIKTDLEVILQEE